MKCDKCGVTIDDCEQRGHNTHSLYEDCSIVILRKPCVLGRTIASLK